MVFWEVVVVVFATVCQICYILSDGGAPLEWAANPRHCSALQWGAGGPPHEWATDPCHYIGVLNGPRSSGMLTSVIALRCWRGPRSSGRLTHVIAVGCWRNPR